MRDFVNVGEMSRNFQTWKNGDLNRGQNPLHIIQVEVQLAIAQQLSVISGHLGKLVEMCEKQSSK